jgi:hypothetical protein
MDLVKLVWKGKKVIYLSKVKIKNPGKHKESGL